MKTKVASVGSILVFAAAVLWGFDGVWRRHLYELPAMIVVFYEHLIGGLLITPFAIGLLRTEKFTRREWIAILSICLLAGVLGTYWFTSALYKVDFISFSVVLLLQKLQPLFAIMAASILLKEKINSDYFKWGALAITAAYFVTFPECLKFAEGSAQDLSFPGCLVNFESSRETWIAALMALGAAFAWGTGTALGRYSLLNHSNTLVAGLRFWITSLFSLGFIYLLGQNDRLFSPTSEQMQYISLIALSTGLVALWIYYRGLKVTQAKVATIMELAFPVTGVFVDVYLYQTVLHWSQYLFAIILIMSMIKLTSTQKAKTDVPLVA